MVTRSGTILRAAIPILLSGGLTALTAPIALEASEAPPCRIRNITQDTFGRSLIRMVERSVDGDRLRVRGRCPGEVRIRTDVDIVGIGEAPTITGRGRHRGVRVDRGARVTLRDLRITRGDVVQDLGDDTGPPGVFDRAGGGGILNRGSLRIVGSVVDRGEAVIGGGIRNRGKLTMVGGALRGNWSAYGGGLHNDGPRSQTTLVGTVVARNEANYIETHGGGILNSGVLRLIDSIVRRNYANGHSGGILNTGTLRLTRSKVISNRTVIGGGGISNDGDGVVTLIDSQVSRNEVRHGEGGGLLNWSGTVTLDASSSVTSNVPDDCVGTPAC